MKQPECFKVRSLSARQVRAIKALYSGSADAYQQRLALSVIVNVFSRSNDILFIPDSPDQSVFLNGRAFVGMQILKTLNVPVGLLTDEEEELDG